MTAIRPLERADLPNAATLCDIGFREGEHPADPEVASFLEQILFDNPWADPDIPSLLATDDQGRSIGLICASTRRMRLGGQPVRLVVTSHFVVDPLARDPLAAPLLIRHLFDGPQDVTVTDTATERTRRIWTRLGGRALHLQGIEWIRIFRPWRITERLFARTGRRTPAALRWLAAALDVPTVAVGGRYLRPAPVDGRVQTLTTGALLESLPLLTDRLKLFPDYDEEFLDWLFREASRTYPEGAVVRDLVVANDGRPIGWYVYVLRQDSVSELLQLAATERGLEAVLDHVFSHAEAHGSAALRGRLEPALVEPIARRHCLLRYSGRALIHSRNAELLQAVTMGDALLTKLEAEWWGDAFAGGGWRR